MAENIKKKPTPQIPPHYVFISDPWFVTTMSNVKYFGFKSRTIMIISDFIPKLLGFFNPFTI